jgi:CRISPR/Cas system-associated exonuclease Cas4 (RecB family)
MKTIRASEIGTYIYCQRAWWFHKSGYESQNQSEMATGAELHEQHGRVVLATGCMRTLAYGLLLSALVLLVIALATQALS